MFPWVLWAILENDRTQEGSSEPSICSQVKQKSWVPRGQLLVTSLQSKEQSYGNEPLACGGRCYLWLLSELN